MIRSILQGAIVLGLFCFAGYGIHYGLKKIGFISGLQKAFRPKPTEEIYNEIENRFSKGTFNDFAESISKYNLGKQKQYIDAYLELRKRKLKGGGRKNDEERSSKKRIGKDKKARTSRTKK